jgi:hypothetical protein
MSLSINPNHLTCYESPFPKVRLGKDNDGGYIIAVIPEMKYSILLAGGIEGDISFEEDFLNRHPKTRCVAFDGTIERLPHENARIDFVRKNVGFSNSNSLTNIHDLISQSNHIFVKMDIEGGEIDWVKSLNESQLNKFEQIVMEFHWAYTDKEVEVFNKLNETHVLVHFHGNNNCGVRTHKGVVMPEVFECTYLHKRHFASPPKLNKQPIPSELDMPNIKGVEDINLNHRPFVHTV